MPIVIVVLAAVIALIFVIASYVEDWSFGSKYFSIIMTVVLTAWLICVGYATKNYNLRRIKDLKLVTFDNGYQRVVAVDGPRFIDLSQKGYDVKNPNEWELQIKTYTTTHGIDLLWSDEYRLVPVEPQEEKINNLNK